MNQFSLAYQPITGALGRENRLTFGRRNQIQSGLCYFTVVTIIADDKKIV